MYIEQYDTLSGKKSTSDIKVIRNVNNYKNIEQYDTLTGNRPSGDVKEINSNLNFFFKF